MPEINQDQFLQLLQKYRDGTATAAEKALFMQQLYLYEQALSGQINADFYNPGLKSLGDDTTRDIIYNTIQLHMSDEQRRQRPKPRLRIMMQYAAAAVVVAVAVGALFWYSRKPATPVIQGITADIAPGHDGAVLTLANGSQVLLDTIKNGLVALQGGATARIVNGALQYNSSGTEMVYNTISTPNGRQFHITLPDGTDVWLNAASKLRFPTVFAGSNRTVEVSGEAYFDIAPDKNKPFFAKVADAEMVEVLGTGFNINTYNPERAVTLIEGAVRVIRTANPGGIIPQHSSIVLAPGQQAVFFSAATATADAAGDASPAIQVRSADTDKVLAWKNGLFQFSNASLAEVMDEIKRWYNIEVVYEKNIPDIYFGGKMSRDLSLAALLRGLNASEVHFRIEEEGRRLVIMP